MPPKDHSFSAVFLAVLLTHAVVIVGFATYMLSAGGCQRSGASVAGAGAASEETLHAVNLQNLTETSAQAPGSAGATAKKGNDPESKIVIPQPKKPATAAKATQPAPPPKLTVAEKPAPKKETPKPEPKVEPAKLDAGKEPKLPERKPMAKTPEPKPAPKVAETKPKAEPKPKPERREPVVAKNPPTPTPKPKPPVAKTEPKPEPRRTDRIPNVPPPPAEIRIDEDDLPPRSTPPPREVVVPEVLEDRPVVPARPVEEPPRPIRRAEIAGGPGGFDNEGEGRFADQSGDGIGRGDGGSGGHDGAGVGRGSGPADMSGYKAQVERMLRARWNEPKGVRPEALPVVRVSISRNGTITFSRLAKSSGDPDLDRSAIDAARIGSRLLPLPPDYGGSSYDLTIRFQLD